MFSDYIYDVNLCGQTVHFWIISNHSTWITTFICTGTCVFSDKETLNKVLWDHHVENHSSKISRRNILICCLLGNKFNCLQ